MGRTGYRHTAEAREKIRVAAVGRTPSQATRAKMRAAKLGVPRSPEAVAKTSAKLRGRAVAHGHAANGSVSPTYRSWASMRERCNNPKHQAFRNYGGRGIAVCARWSVFANFLADMGVRPDGRTLDRIDNDRGYTPDNCRWATREEQAQNRRRKSPSG